MPNHIYAHASVLTNVGGRIDYISSAERQEHLLYADNPDQTFWSDLARFNKLKQAKNGAGDPAKLAEAREWIVPIPPDAWNDTWNRTQAENPRWSKSYLEEMMAPHFARLISEELNGLIKELEGVEVETVTAIHFSGRDEKGVGINPHAHIILAERIKEEKPRLETRNQWRDAKGFKVTAKDKERREASGEKGFTLTLKGEPNPDYLFSDKLKCLTADRIAFGEQFKERLAERWTVYANETEYTVFDKQGPFLAQNKVGKNSKNQELLDSIREANKATTTYNKDLQKAIDYLESEGNEGEPEILLEKALELKAASQEVDPDQVKAKERWKAWKTFIRDLHYQLVQFWNETFFQAPEETKVKDLPVETVEDETLDQEAENDRYGGFER